MGRVKRGGKLRRGGEFPHLFNSLSMFGFFAVKKELLQLREDFDKLRRDFRGIEQEWLDTLDRNKRVMGRIVKRAQSAEVLTDQPDEQTNGPDLSKMDPISRKIWQRRLNRELLPR